MLTMSQLTQPAYADTEKRVSAHPAHSHHCPNEMDALTDRERDVLAFMAAGFSNVGISTRMYLSTKTVEAHVSSIFSKLGLAADSGGNRRVAAVLVWLAHAPPARG